MATHAEASRYTHVRSFERGQLLILTLLGALEVSDYRIESYLPYASNSDSPWETHELTGTHSATDRDLTNLDRLNRAGYRDAKPAGRQDLGRNWQTRVPHPGMEVSLALKNFKEQGSYVERLQIWC